MPDSIRKRIPFVTVGTVLYLLTTFPLAYIWHLVIFSARSVLANAAQFFVLLGGYHWTTHVLAEAAKHEIAPLSTWFSLESIYLAIQFALAGVLLALLHRRMLGNVEQGTTDLEDPAV